MKISSLTSLMLAAMLLSHPASAADQKLHVTLPANHWSEQQVHAAQARCKMALKGIAADYEMMEAFGTPGGCGAPAPVMLRSVAGIGLQPPIITNCDMAQSLYGWIGTSLAAGASQDLEKQLVQVNTASDYVCRRRNSQSGGKMSEHAKANALDISSLQFSDGSVMKISGEWIGLKALFGLNKKSFFLKRIRRDACIRFTTVLGPGTDPFHGDHFHLDLIARRNGYRICK